VLITPTAACLAQKKRGVTYGTTGQNALPLGMTFQRFLLLSVIVLPVSIACAQEPEVKATSATDAKVVIHKGKRVKATEPPKKFKTRYNEKQKKAVNVSDPKPKVQTTNRRQQKRNSKFRINGRD
jgi:hypothetical protein